MGRQKKNNNHKISVVLPVFNEPKILKTLKTLDEELARAFAKYEIVCVNDGSFDETLAKIRRFNSPKLKLVTYPLNVGKGFALCHGFTQASGDMIAFLDSDLEIHPKQLRLFTDLMDLVKADIVIGSKRHPLSQVNYSFSRKLYSRGFQFLVRLLFGLKVRDTQVGIKLFRRRVLEKVVPRIVVKRWAFDLELLVVAHHLGFRRIIEAPIELKKRRFGSKINLGSVRHFLVDTAAIFYRRHLVKHYDRALTASNHKRYRIKPQKKTRKK